MWGDGSRKYPHSEMCCHSYPLCEMAQYVPCDLCTFSISCKPSLGYLWHLRQCECSARAQWQENKVFTCSVQAQFFIFGFLHFLIFGTTSCYVPQAGLELWSSCLSFLSAGITGKSYHTQLKILLSNESWWASGLVSTLRCWEGGAPTWRVCVGMSCAPLLFGCSCIVFFVLKRFLYVKCFPELWEPFYKVIELEEGLTGTPIYSQTLRPRLVIDISRWDSLWD
jgi:hypothetical protein